MDKNKELKHIAEHYGIDAQLEKTKEELNELVEEVEKFQQFKKNYVLYRMIDEIADVENMIDQLKLLLKIAAEVDEVKEYKIARQLKRISEEGINNDRVSI